LKKILRNRGRAVGIAALAGIGLIVLVMDARSGFSVRADNRVAAACVNNPVVTSTADSGPGSFRQAIADACRGSKITFAVTGDIILTSGELDIDQDLTIHGPGAGRLTISGNNTALHVFNIGNVTPAIDVTLSGLKISGGNADMSGVELNGGGILNNATGTLTLTGCKISGNRASGRGGGLWNGSGTITITNSTISKNTTGRFGGGVLNDDGAQITITDTVMSGNLAMFDGGGAVCNFGTATIAGCTISRNNAGNSGGGIFSNSAGVLNVSDTTISDNDTTFGGGIIIDAGTANVANCAIFGNSASEAGGVFSSGTLNVTNTTITGNSATNFPTGGLLNFSGTTTITNCTISGNTVTNSSDGGVFSGGTTNVRNTIIALNTAAFDPDVGANFTSQGHNLIGKSDGSTGFSDGVNGDQVGSIASPLDPELGPLRNNGGTTLSRALRKSSPAIDAGDDSVLDAPLSLTTDQRGPGFPRKVGVHVDIGAFEFQHKVSTTFRGENFN